MNKLPILIVAYCRSERLAQILDALSQEQRRIYVAIDKAPEPLMDSNNLVIKCAESYKSKLNMRIHINQIQAGVKFGVPRAIDWILQFENECIVLEDDCAISNEALGYFDEMKKYLGGEIALISGDSPWEPGELGVSTLSNYPLIWGWVTNREQWGKLRTLIGGMINWKDVAKALISRPSSILSISYFLAAQIKVKKGKLQAWDCSVALNMLTMNLKCVIPNTRLIDNLGNDEFAHHTLKDKSIPRNLVRFADLVSTTLEKDISVQRATNKAIVKRVYKMRKLQIFSPLKSILLR